MWKFRVSWAVRPGGGIGRDGGGTGGVPGGTGDGPEGGTEPSGARGAPVAGPSCAGGCGPAPGAAVGRPGAGPEEDRGTTAGESEVPVPEVSSGGA